MKGISLRAELEKVSSNPVRIRERMQEFIHRQKAEPSLTVCQFVKDMK